MDARWVLILGLVLYPASPPATATAQNREKECDDTTLTLLNKDACQARPWHKGDILKVVLPIQSGTAYLWDLAEVSCDDARQDDPKPARLLSSFDDPAVRDMTKTEADRYRGDGGGPLGGFDRMQILRVRLDRPGIIHLDFRKFRAFDRRPSNAEADQFVVKLRVVAVPALLD